MNAEICYRYLINNEMIGTLGHPGKVKCKLDKNISFQSLKGKIFNWTSMELSGISSIESIEKITVQGKVLKMVWFRYLLKGESPKENLGRMGMVKVKPNSEVLISDLKKEILALMPSVSTIVSIDKLSFKN